MTKEEFLTTLDRKLQVINEKERRDIIDEYRTHIEMKMQEGKSEEEVIADFGDIDELVNEILDAYKINTNHSNGNFDAKVNRFMDELYDGFKRFLGSFTSLEVDDVVRLIFEIFIILLLLAILRIPFEIVASLGSSLLRSVIGLGIGNVLGGIWKLIINFAYIVIFIVVLVNLISKRVSRYRGQTGSDGKTVFDDFKDSMQGMTNKRQRHNTMYNERDDQTKKDEEAMYTENPYTSSNDIEDDMQEEHQERTHAYSYTRQPYERDRSMGDSVGGFVDVLLKVFFCLIMIPFIAIIVGLCCALGAMVVLSFEGLTLFGAYFIVIGGIILTSAFLSAMHRALWRRR